MLRETLILAVAASAVSAQTFRPDGVFDEWASVPVAATDPTGDNSGSFDLTEVKAVVKGSRLYLAWDTGAPNTNLQSGPSGDGTIRIELDFSSGTTLTIDLRARVAYENGNTNNGVSWNDIAYDTLPSTASDRYETEIELSGYTSGPGDTFTLDFSGSDSLSSPVNLSINTDDQPVTEHPNARDPSTAFRIFSLNTLSTGLTNSTRGPRIRRLIDAFDPDIVCLQEEYNDSASTIASQLNAIDPLDDGATWSVQKFDDCAVASPYTFIPKPSTPDDEFGAAVIDFGNGEAVLVISTHPKCCGYAGSSEDIQRVGEMQVMADMIADFRAGTLGGALAPYADAPIVVIGDWNLVGSTAPLEVITDPAGPDLTHLIVPHLVGEHAVTWHDADGFGFSPGMLDITTYDAAHLTALNHFVVDTTVMSGATLSALGLQSDDSTGSDHWATVADFAFPGAAGPCSPADLTTQGAGSGDPNYGVPDGAVTAADIQYYVNLYTASDPAADFTTQGAGIGDPNYGVPDGAVTAADIQYYVNIYIAGCP